MYDVGIVGGGIAGMATAARLQARGLSTVVLEAHNLPGGWAGFYRRNGFSFDVGATTLVDFDEQGIGGQFLESIGIESLEAERLPGYVAWLPDRRVVLHQDRVPLINAALGITIRGAGLTRARGGMRGFWMTLLTRYRELGGELRSRCAVNRIEGRLDRFLLQTVSGELEVRQVVSAVPASITSEIAPRPVADWLYLFVRRDAPTPPGFADVPSCGAFSTRTGNAES